jgi:hypothetical protein
MRDNIHALCFLHDCFVWISYHKDLNGQLECGDSFKSKGMHRNGSIASLQQPYL